MTISKEELQAMMAYMPSSFDGVMRQAAQNVDELIDTKMSQFEGVLSEKLSDFENDPQLAALNNELTETMKAHFEAQKAAAEAMEAELTAINELIAGTELPEGFAEALHAKATALAEKKDALKDSTDTLIENVKGLTKKATTFGISAARKAIGI